jgi:glycerol-3-phosphate acyltransferase PlsY
MRYWLIPIIALACYLIGGINFALIISRFKKNDIRTADSGNPGAMNMARKFGAKIGFLTLALDALKGIAGALLGWLLLGDELFKFGTDQLGKFIGGLSVIIGHIYPVFLKFKGGKGIASIVGVCLVISPIALIISFAAAFLFILVTKIGTPASFIAIFMPLALSAYNSAKSGSYLIPIFCLAIFFLTLWKHRKNLVRLFSGTENKTSITKKKNKEKKDILIKLDKV